MIDFDSFRWFRLEPVDAWFFRDGRPSNRGENQTDLESEFPPRATTVVGGIRAALARANGWSGSGSWANESAELVEVLGDGFDNLGNLHFLGPFLCKRFTGNWADHREELLWPLPRHVVGRMKDGRFEPMALLEPSQDSVICDLSDGPVRLPDLPSEWASDEQQKRPELPERIYVTTTGLNALLSKKLPSAEQCVSVDDLYALESRVGIFRDSNTRTTGQNALYSPRYVRLKPGVSLVEAVAGIPTNWTVPTLIMLGGESRMAAIEPLNHSPALPVELSNQAPGQSDLSVLINLTPTSFGSPWWGAGIGEEAKGLAVSLHGSIVSATFDRPMRIGGWNELERKPIALRAFLPAGSVWWLDGQNETRGQIIQLGQQQACGFGLAVVGSSSKS